MLSYYMSDPITVSNALKTQIQDLNNDKSNQILEEQNAINNVSNEILVKQDQLEKMKSDQLQNQLQKLNDIESNVINKDRIIEQIQSNMNHTNKNIYVLFIALFLSIALFASVILYALGNMSQYLFTIIVIVIIILFIFLVMYNYNILFFATVTNFIDNRKNLKLAKSVAEFASNIKGDAQEAKYGDKQDFIDENCLCEDDFDNEIYAEEEDVAVKIKPGYFYYDKNAPKQLLLPNGGLPNNVSADPNVRVFDKIDWVNHDQVMYGLNELEEGHYQIEPNDREYETNGLLVNDTTYTINL